MILVDANLLLYAYDVSSPVHEPASSWLTEALSGQEPIGLSWHTVLAFLRIATSPKLFQDPFSIGEAISIVDDWFSQPVTRLIHAGEAHWGIFRNLLLETKVRGPLVMDAHLAALAIEHDMILVSRDRDFARFQGLSSSNPLAEEREE